MSTRLPGGDSRAASTRSRACGWIETRQRGSHVRLERGGVKITIADHGGSVIVPRGTLGGILKEARMTVDDLRTLL
jgi:predicted RNA binding protein YcfA (HicA-like mRNA interferase family)